MGARALKYLVFPLTAWSLLALAPPAVADPSPSPGPAPQAGSESAGATVRDLKTQGYNVQLNWVIGSPEESLDNCTVDNVNTVDQATAYVDVDCPR
ncbi:MAG TPA: hypothetical protein VFW21_01595 [Mycobacterium sp.]|nr:hypothetical protein [Mycobacterium sp.]